MYDNCGRYRMVSAVFTVLDCMVLHDTKSYGSDQFEVQTAHKTYREEKNIMSRLFLTEKSG